MWSWSMGRVGESQELGRGSEACECPQALASGAQSMLIFSKLNAKRIIHQSGVHFKPIMCV